MANDLILFVGDFVGDESDSRLSLRRFLDGEFSSPVPRNARSRFPNCEFFKDDIDEGVIAPNMYKLRKETRRKFPLSSDRKAGQNVPGHFVQRSVPVKIV